MSTGQQRSKQPSSRAWEAELMAVVLEGRHGSFAADVAEFFAAMHVQQGDSERSNTWKAVARLIHKREYERLLEAEVPAILED